AALAAATGAMMLPVTRADASPAAAAGPAAAGPGARLVDYRRWDTDGAFASGTRRGTVVGDGRLRLDAAGAAGLGSRTLDGRRYDEGTWRSGWHEPGFALTSLIPSWSAATPRDSVVEVEVRGRTADGRTSSWDLMARWAAGDQHVRRTTVAGQGDDLARVDTDTWTVTAAGGVTAYQLRVRLLRREGQRATPRLEAVGAMASRLPAGTPAPTQPGDVRGRVLDVPRYSQMIHQGHFPQWGGGGEAWCSPTATSMVLSYYDALPGRRASSWVPDGHRDPWVDVAARATYDHGYDGTGNWAFNTAWAASRLGGGEAFVTRLTGARQAERFIAAGIPLIASVTFGPGELDGAPIGSTAGHLLVIVGFDAAGDVVVNDPAASSASGVRRTYDRAQLERAWLTRSGGLVYVLRDADHPLPPRGAATAW
ncbi:peptidase C39 family protein, partial [Nocardioides aquaticus]